MQDKKENSSVGRITNTEDIYSGESGVNYAKNVGQEWIEHPGYQFQATRFTPHLAKEDSVLDFGCGNGSVARQILKQVRTLKGLEVNPYTREMAKKQIGTEVYASIEEIPKSEVFDVIYTNHVLEHIENPIETLRQLSVHLRPGGRMIIVVPAEDFRSGSQKDWWEEDSDHHLHTWTQRLMANTLRHAGLSPTNVKIESIAWVPQLFFLGNTGLFRFFCRLKGIVLRRHEIIALATLGHQ